VLGSDKTTVSVATGQNEYYLLYISIGNVHNCVQCAHHGAVSLVGFLTIPKSKAIPILTAPVLIISDCTSADAEYSDTVAFWKFRRQIFHLSLAMILKSLKPGMTEPEVVHCADGHLQHVIYGLGSYIADYPEQVILACIVSGWCVQ